MPTRLIASIAAALGLLCSTVPGAAAEAAKPVTHTVTIEGNSFQPADLTVNPGDTIVWRNKDPYPHTVTSASGGFDSKTIAPETSWKYVPKKAGAFEYACSFHPTMKATLTVK